MTIRANHVTAARLFTIPFVAMLFYGEQAWLILAVVLGSIIGLTDSLDGYLARKHGPTIIGGVMDPIADKVFIACAFLPYIDRAWAPWWLAGAILSREFLVTALRTGLARQGDSRPSSLLAKIKTWVQMVGIGILVLAVAIETVWIMHAVNWGLCGVALIGGIIGLWRGKGAWRHSWVGLIPALTNAGAYSIAGADGLVLWTMVVVVGVTWVSAADYFAGSIKKLGARGLFAGFTFVRLLSAAVFPLLATIVLVLTPAPAWAIIGVVSIELAHGGLDSFLVTREAATPALHWLARNVAMSVLLAGLFFQPAWAIPLAATAMAIALLDMTRAFVSNRRLFADALGGNDHHPSAPTVPTTAS